MDNIVDKARSVCMSKHEGQRDKLGEPYYKHPFAVADMLDGETEKSVAYLHDVLEDTDTTAEWLLEQGFPAEVVSAIEEVTRRDGETYADFIGRIANGSETARRVKCADLKHNMDPSRRGGLSPKLEARYRSALETLERT
ncbi:MAG: bifunctional (p)ppGpp synthetase/guanosine-3',5'-bis(diphosphate) 3'-pyrophosphohydrolase [Atopobiaceae bacterium]|nr:bifunctional (p)ppGpp synthetase/guanosine-3',5'-bis(diphosphate) 3'-pyrophosphohydrolase [Atopobiaceae bacterium]